MGDEITNVDDFKNKIILVLFKDEENPNINSFLNLTITELNNWYNYITSDFENAEIIYQTLHSSKGLQYENVVIALDDNFARDRRFFQRFFESYNNESSLSDDSEKVKYAKAENLLYVGVTRTINNLLVFYNFEPNNKVEETTNYIFNYKI